ncbi:MAG: VCBS repeat-containing protein, partial [Bacteroidetes bacterium]|nr:VCBS repeat-containing protein [Bacteroidota bacterium]
KDELEDYIQHTSLASMGADMQDINNDGYPDIFTTDMLPADDYRVKTTSSFDNYDVYHLKEQSGFYHQFMQNTIQLNNKNGKFMEIANYAGVQASDWSWGGLMFDADNDGYNDLYVCNGITHDLTNQDFIDFFASDIVQRMVVTGKKDEVDAIINKMPSTPLKNKAFRNLGNFRFKDIGDDWGFTKPSFSNGAAYGDLDNDGDLDLVVNNVNSPAFIYRNNSVEKNKTNYIGFTLKGKGKNTFAIGAKVEVFSGDQIFTREEIPSRGFQSSVDYKIIIGLGKINKIDSVKVIWPDRKISVYQNIPVNKVQHFDEPETTTDFKQTEITTPSLFTQVNTTFDKHQEDDYVDFYAQRNLPMLLSREGPRATVGDVNGDGLQDVYICGANKTGGQLYIQTSPGNFIQKTEPAFKLDTDHEEVVCLFFDCDGDGDLDLYVGAGGNNQAPNTHQLEHRLFKNDGKGNFTLFDKAFPPNGSNVGAVVAADFDNDGDLDLFVGGRNVSYLYGVTPPSYIFINDGQGHFTDIAATKNKDIAHLGMITGAAWADITGDKEKELIVTGEWMTPKIFSWSKDHFENIKTNLDSLFG